MAARTEFETVFVEVEDRIATITINRPDKLNTYNFQMMADLVSAFDLTDADDAVGAVIVTGAGKSFCGGLDLSEYGVDSFEYSKRPERRELDELERIRDCGGILSLRIFDSLKPVIAACNGAAVGIGSTMQLPMDFRLASKHAKYGFVFARRGIVVEGCSSYFLPRIVGVPTALDWCYSGRVFGAQEALERGLVQSIHEPEDLLPASRAIAREIIDNTAPVSIAITRQAIWRMLGADHPMEAHKLESRALHERGQTREVKDGIQAFLEKRDAVFPDTVSKDMPSFFPWWEERPFA
jgi:enoyl-CoA hydratase/carnithine racemase